MAETKPKGLDPTQEWVWENSKPGSFARRCVAWVAEQQASQRRAEEEWRERCPLYIRFGDLPRTPGSCIGVDRSRPRWEKGISVFRGYEADDGAYVVSAANLSQAVMYKLVAREGRTVYLATGREIAAGSDQEPVLADAELTPLPEGTRVRCCEEGGPYGALLLALFAPSWMRAPTPEIVVGGPLAPAEPFGGDLSAAEGRRDFAIAIEGRATEAAAGALHGPEHWKRVALTGAKIAAATLGSDPLTVFLFAVLHDSARIHDHPLDNWHGWRAANLAREVLGAVLPAGDLDKLAYAIEEHDAGKTSEDATVGVCWDSDRLNLWRVGAVPDPALLSTAAAKKPSTRAWAKALQHAGVTWEQACGLAPFELEVTAEQAGRVGENLMDPLNEQVRGHLERWGMLEDAERYGLVGPADQKSKGDAA